MCPRSTNSPYSMLNFLFYKSFQFNIDFFVDLYNSIHFNNIDVESASEEKQITPYTFFWAKLLILLIFLILLLEIYFVIQLNWRLMIIWYLISIIVNLWMIKALIEFYKFNFMFCILCLVLVLGFFSIFIFIYFYFYLHFYFHFLFHF